MIGILGTVKLLEARGDEIHVAFGEVFRLFGLFVRPKLAKWRQEDLVVVDCQSDDLRVALVPNAQLKRWKHRQPVVVLKSATSVKITDSN